MTDLLEQAEQKLTECDSALDNGKDDSALMWLYGAVRLHQSHLRSTPAAPARTEEGKSFADPTGTYADKRGTYAGQVEPSDALVEINQLCRALAGRSDLDESGLYESAARVRDLLKAEGRSSAARELAEIREACSLTRTQEFAGKTTLEIVQATSVIMNEVAGNLAKERNESEARDRYAGGEISRLNGELGKKDRELAELREKVKAWDRVVRSGFALIDQVGNESGSASGVHGPQFDARLVELIQAVCALTPTELPQNLRPGSGSDEGKA